jgi:hypothetical protein
MAFEILMLCIIKDILVQEQLLNDMALEARNNLTRNVPSEDRENPSTTSIMDPQRSIDDLHHGGSPYPFILQHDPQDDTTADRSY